MLELELEELEEDIDLDDELELDELEEEDLDDDELELDELEGSVRKSILPVLTEAPETFTCLRATIIKLQSSCRKL